MSRIRIKMMIAVLSVSLFGCSTARYTVQPISSTSEPVPVARISTVNGSRYDVENLEITDDSVTGRTASGIDFRIPRSELDRVEVRTTKFDVGKTFIAILAVPVTAILLYFVICHNDDGLYCQ